MNSKTLGRLILALLPVLGPAPLARPALATPQEPERPATSYTRHLPLVTNWYSPKAPPTHPLAVSANLNPGRAISATIPITGGTLTTTTADGTRFTLTIPNNA